MRNKKAISLIVLVITIIVMIILAAAVVITLSNTGIIDRASEATYETELKQVQMLANLAWSDAYTAKMLDPNIDIETEVRAVLERQGITRDKYVMETTDKGVVIKAYTSKGTMQDKTIIGKTPITLSNSAGVNLLNYKVYGNSVQNGTPTPALPSQIESVGEKTSNIADLSKCGVSITTDHVTYTYDNATGTIEYTSAPTQYDYILLYLERDVGYEFEMGKRYYCGADVTVTGKQTNDKTVINFGLNYVDSPGTAYAVNKNGTYHFGNTFVYEGQETIRLMIHANYGSNEAANVKFENIFVSEKNEFEPYGYRIPVKVSCGEQETITTILLDEPLRKIDEYADYIDFENKKVVRKIATKVFDGTETIYDIATGDYRYTYFVLGKRGLVTDDVCLSTHFAHQANFSYTRPGNNMFRMFNSTSVDETRIVFRFYLDGNIINNPTTVKNLLKDYYNQGNPVIMYYAHADGLETTQAIDLPKVATLKDNCTLSVDTTVKPSNVELTYKVIE